MFSPLARGKASWDGGVEYEEYLDLKSPIGPLFPQLLSPSTPCNKSAKSTGSFVLDDGQLSLPKTFVTRKGAILLFTPSDELCNHGNGEHHLKKENVYEAGLKLRTLGNLTNSVLEFGKEDEEAWEGILDNPKETSERESHHKKDNSLFLRFLHYLDSENLTADKHVQPGADPDYYLEELKKSSGHNSPRRFRSHTPFSTKTSHSSNAYSHFLEDDDEITSIIEDYMKSNKSGWSPDKEHLEHGVVSSDHIPDIRTEGYEAIEEHAYFSSPRSPRVNHSRSNFSPSMPNMSSSPFQEADDLISRPKTAPIPPTLDSPRANPRITIAKPPPVLRALGSTPSHLDEIINADVGFGRYQRQGQVSWRRLSRSPSPSFHLGSSRGATPDHVRFQRMASPDGKSEEWNRAAQVIEEEDESSTPAHQGGSGKCSRRPSSAGSLQSKKDEKMSEQRRASSAGTTNRKSRSSVHSSRSASLSSVSNVNNRTLSAMSSEQEHLARSPELNKAERENSSPWPGMRDDFTSLQNDLAEDFDQNLKGQIPGHIGDSRKPSPTQDSIVSPSRGSVISPLFDSSVKNPSPPMKSPSVSSRVASPSTRPPSVQSRLEREYLAGSRLSSAASSEDHQLLWEEAVNAADIKEGRKSSTSSLGEEAAVVSRQSDHNLEENRLGDETRTPSAKSVSGGAETKATLGSEADLTQVSKAIVRSQSVIEDVYEDMLAEEETAGQEWPGKMEPAEEIKPDDVNKGDDNESIKKEKTISSPEGPSDEEFLPIEPPNEEESLVPVSTQPASPPGTTKHNEREQERPVTEVHEDEAVTSVVAMDVHENEATPLVTTFGGAERTDDLVMRSDTSTTEPTVTVEDSADALDSEPLASTLTNHSVDIQEVNESATGAPGKSAATFTVTGAPEKPAKTLTITGASENPAKTLTAIGASEKPAKTLTATSASENPAKTLTATSASEKPAKTLTLTGASEKTAKTLTATGASEKTAKTLTEAPRSSSPAPIKADQILHKELLAETGLEIDGKIDNRRPPSPYKETIDIEKSRPSSPVTEEQRNIPVNIGEAVRTYLETGKEPQVRERSARSRRGSETDKGEKANSAKAVEKEGRNMEAKQPVISPKPDVTETSLNRQTKPKLPKGLSSAKSKAESKPELPGLNLMKNDDKGREVKVPTVEEREARRQMVSSLLSKRDAPKDGKLELEGFGKEGEESEGASEVLVTRASPAVAEKKKNDLSDLAALVAKSKTPSKPKEKKPESKKKTGKPSKSGKKKSDTTIDPNNIDFAAFNTPEMLEGMDDELRQFIQEQSKSDVTSAMASQPAEAAVSHEEVKRQESVQILEVPHVAEEIPPKKRDAHAPSKPKKPSKKELAKIRADHRKEEKKRKEEERRMKEEEVRLMKEREEEAVRAKAEAEEKQRNIEEEMLKRLAEEEEARKHEQEALEKLKEAKKKAREERESRRAAEAERRRLEVQKKREEKKKREEELREREKELEQQRMDHEKRMAEIEEARRRKQELERLEEEQRREEERLLALQEEEDERRLEEEKIREAEEELRRLQEEREYREQMRRIAEMQEAKLRQEEEERLRREEEERQRMEEERRKREEEEEKRLLEEQRRLEMARRLEALARMRSAEAAARRKALLLKRREGNVERMQNLKNTRCGQHVTRAFVFTYYSHIPRKVWEVPIGFNKKKKGFGAPRKKPAPPKLP